MAERSSSDRPLTLGEVDGEVPPAREVWSAAQKDEELRDRRLLPPDPLVAERTSPLRIEQDDETVSGTTETLLESESLCRECSLDLSQRVRRLRVT